MNGVDTAILVVTLLSCLFGLWRGFAKEVLSLLTWVAALLLADMYSAAVADYLVNLIENSSVRYITAFALVFIIIMLLGTLLNNLLSRLLNLSGLNLADRLMGAIFGVARGVAIVLVALFVTHIFVSETDQWQKSRFVPYGLAMIERSLVLIEDIDTVDLGQQTDRVQLR